MANLYNKQVGRADGKISLRLFHTLSLEGRVTVVSALTSSSSSVDELADAWAY